MATPANPLDKFATYTYHFELHADHDWEKLKLVDQGDANDVTDRFTPNGTLLINTRKDAHQTIDNVNFMVVSEAVNLTSNMTALGELSLDVHEPGGFSFIEKLDTIRKTNQCNVIGSLIFGLKIFFVGRTSDNVIETVSMRIIPLQMLMMNGKYDERGGTYQLKFGINSVYNTATSPAEPTANYSFFRRNISFGARTIGEALTLFQVKLNEDYEDVYSKELYATTGKKLNYIIKFDPVINGRLDTLNKDTLAPGSFTNFAFDARLPIRDHIYTILKSSKEFQDKIAASASTVNKEFQPGLFMPFVTIKVNPTATRIDVIAEVGMNTGGAQNKYDFDYFFAGAGKNIDVMSYNVEMKDIQAWMPTSSRTGFDESLNQSGRMQTERTTSYVKNICHPDVTVNSNHTVVERSTVPCNTNDVQIQPAANRSDRAGYVTSPYDSTASLRLASSVMIDFQATIQPAQTFEIRGHLDLLDSSITHPDSAINGGFFGGNNTWIKVNIFMLDPREPDGKRQFYYTGYSRVLTVNNTFNNGMFKQSILMMMYV